MFTSLALCHGHVVQVYILVHLSRFLPKENRHDPSLPPLRRPPPSAAPRLDWRTGRFVRPVAHPAPRLWRAGPGPALFPPRAPSGCFCHRSWPPTMRAGKSFASFSRGLPSNRAGTPLRRRAPTAKRAPGCACATCNSSIAKWSMPFPMGMSTAHGAADAYGFLTGPRYPCPTPHPIRLTIRNPTGRSPDAGSP